MNLRTKFYLALGKRLEQIIDNEGHKIIKHIDLWNNQFDGDQVQPTSFPAVYLEFKPISWQTTGKHKQQSQLQFTLHIANTTKARGELNQLFTDRFLAHLELIDIIHKWITGFNSSLDPDHEDFFGSISRIASTHDHYHDDILVHQEHFVCNVKDTTAMTDYTKTTAGLVVDTELILSL